MKSHTSLVVGCAAALLFGGILSEKIFPTSRVTTSEHRSHRRTAPALRPQPTSGASSAFALEPGDPDDALCRRDEGYQHIATLQASGDFQRAADFATAEAAEFRRDWTIAAYFEWGRRQPESAFVAASRIVEPTSRGIALQAIFSGWASNDPEGLAQLSLDRPEGPEKIAALTKAMREWVHRDPDTAGSWISAHTEVIPVVEKMFRDDRR